VLYLIRHGETDWNREPTRCQGWSDVPLNDTGRAQSRAQGAALRDHGIELIVSSNLIRARETAEILREELGGGVQLTFDARLAETNRGRWEARLFSDIIAQEPDAWRAYREHPASFRFPGGESLQEQQRRVLEGVEKASDAFRHRVSPMPTTANLGFANIKRINRGEPVKPPSEQGSSRQH